MYPDLSEPTTRELRVVISLFTPSGTRPRERTSERANEPPALRRVVTRALFSRPSDHAPSAHHPSRPFRPSVASPSLASPRLASPRLASPRLASPRLASFFFRRTEVGPVSLCFVIGSLTSSHSYVRSFFLFLFLPRSLSLCLSSSWTSVTDGRVIIRCRERPARTRVQTIYTEVENVIDWLEG